MARFAGYLNGLELLALDTFLRHRPAEPNDERIVLVGFDEADLQKTGYPIPTRTVIDLLNTLQTYKPTIIGMHMLQSQMAQSNNASLLAGLNQPQKRIASETILTAANQVGPPPGFPTAQVGLIDIIPDGDSHLRRAILGTFDPLKTKTYKLSLTIQLVERYLSAQDKNLTLENGLRDPKAMRFGAIELPRLRPSGAYAGAETGNPQILLNFRQRHQPFHVLSSSQVRTGKVDPNWLRDRIVIVGITDPTIRPVIPTAAIDPTNSLDVQAHAASQIVSAVLDGRPLLDNCADGWEYLWILGLGGIALVIGRSNLRLQIKLISLGIVQVGLVGMSYGLLLWGWWIPVVPASLVWFLNGTSCTVLTTLSRKDKA